MTYQEIAATYEGMISWLEAEVVSREEYEATPEDERVVKLMFDWMWR